jgi:hypothetical protein
MHNRLDRYLYHSGSTDRSGFTKLYDAIRHPVAAHAYTDVHGNVFRIQEDGPYWTKPLKHNVLIVDIDTKVRKDTNELWNNGSMSWEGLRDNGGGIISASQMNHFLYGQFHKRIIRTLQGFDV